jgi:hypothetical protein
LSVYGSPPDWIDNLHKFGELAIVHDGAHSIKSKLQDKGLLCLFVGYPENHAGEVCQFLNLATKRIILSRSAIFLHKTNADFHKLAKDQISIVQPTDDGLTIGDVLPNPNKPIEHNDNNENNLDNLVEDIPDDLSDEDYTTATSEEDIVPLNITNRGLRELRNLQTYYNPNPLQYIDDNSNNVALQATIYDGNPDPKSVMIGQTGGEQYVLNSKACMIIKFGKSYTKTMSFITGKFKAIAGYLLKKMMDGSEPEMLHKVIHKFLEKTFRNIIHQL